MKASVICLRLFYETNLWSDCQIWSITFCFSQVLEKFSIDRKFQKGIQQTEPSLKFISCGHSFSPSSSLYVYPTAHPKTLWGDLQTSQLWSFLCSSRYLRRTRAHYLTHPLSSCSNILHSFSALNLRSKQGSRGTRIPHLNSFYLNQFWCLFSFWAFMWMAF